jgi:hypothetical protein
MTVSRNEAKSTILRRQKGNVVAKLDVEGEAPYLWNAVPSLCDEYRQTLSNIVEGSEPTTVMHALLLERSDPPTKEGIAAILGRQTYEIEGVLESLDEEGWLLRFVENGLEKYALHGPRKRASVREL